LTAGEIVTGERLQALAESMLLPRAIARRHTSLDRHAAAVIDVAQHREIDAAQIDRISASRSIFVYADALELFQEHVWPRLTGTGYVLITHNGDAGVGAEQRAWVDAAGGRIAHWFAQNLLVEHALLSPLPIGVANRMWDHGDLRALWSAIGAARRSSPSQLVHARFTRETHPDRERAWAAVRSSFPGLAATATRALSFAAYLAELADHRYCICPRGNGIDTHRFWECQYLGVVPIVERSPHTERWAREGLPMLALDDWSGLSRERLEAEPLDPLEATAAPLRLSHHAGLIARAAAGAAIPAR